MGTPEKLRPAEMFPPSDFLREEVEARGLDAAKLAEAMNPPSARKRNANRIRPTTESDAKELIEGTRLPNDLECMRLYFALGISASFWMHLRDGWIEWCNFKRAR